jgi:hypothetical protein
MQNSTMEYASWQRPLYGFEISQNQAKTPLKSGFSDGLGGAVLTFGLPLSRKATGRRTLFGNLGKADASIALRSLLHRLATAQSTHRKPAANRQAAQRIRAICEGERRHNAFVSGLFLL